MFALCHTEPVAWLSRKSTTTGHDASEVDTARFDALCGLCGAAGPYVREPDRRADMTFRCQKCRAGVRFQVEAWTLIELYAPGGDHGDLGSLVDSGNLDDLRVHYVGSSGPVRKRLARLPRFSDSVYRPGEAHGAELGDRRTNENHESLSFDDESIDLMVSSHVLEHVPSPRAALTEAFRVVRPGGRYAFSVPMRHPLPQQSIVCAEVVDGEVVHLRSDPKYHKSPEGEPALVFTIFGVDLLDLLRDIGFVAFVRRPYIEHDLARRVATVVAEKPVRAAA